MKREFLKLCQTYTDKISPAGWLLSEKLDGVRCFWDGGCTRGKLASEVPWANTEKDYRYISAPVATGLWSRYGKVIHAPDWFLDSLPLVMLDGELHCGRGSFQQVVSAVKKLIPVCQEWKHVKFIVFDAPAKEQIFADGKINNPNFKKEFQGILGSGVRFPSLVPPLGGFVSRYRWLCSLVPNVLTQIHLPYHTPGAIQKVDEILDSIVKEGGEGVVLTAPHHLWTPERSWTCLKYKKVLDAEGTVIGYTWGKGKLLGLMGALVLMQDNGKTLELSGFTDAERKMVCSENPLFPKGSRVTYKYRELTKDGVAKEARYWRKA